MSSPPFWRRPGVTLGLLLLIYTSNFIDRTIVGIVAQPMKEDLGLSDGQLGLLGGLAFALFYSGLGLPIARLADRRSRVDIVALALLAWSGFPAACGATQSFIQLFLARLGVGIGEAGCTPAAQSLIYDLYPAERRPMAMSIYGLGVPLGVLFGAVLGGAIVQHLGWRAAFVIVGLPGIVLALVFRLVVKEPERLAGPAEAAPRIGLYAAAAQIWRTPGMAHLMLGAGAAAFGGYSVQAFAVPFLLRDFAVPIGPAAYAFGLLAGGASAIGTFAGGWLSQRFAPMNASRQAAFSALGLVLAGPLYALLFLQHSLTAVALMVAAPAILQYLYLGPTYALVNNLAPPSLRATSVALLLLAMNLIGLGLGPLATGALSDQLTAITYGSGYAQACAPSAHSATCTAAAGEGLRLALVAASLSFVWAGGHFVVAARRLRAHAAAPKANLLIDGQGQAPFHRPRRGRSF